MKIAWLGLQAASHGRAHSMGWNDLRLSLDCHSWQRSVGSQNVASGDKIFALYQGTDFSRGRKARKKVGLLESK
jgi:hypothetical protein